METFISIDLSWGEIKEEEGSIGGKDKSTEMSSLKL